MTNPEIFSAPLDEAASSALAGGLAELLQPGDCVALHGELGAGKSSFCRAAIKTLSNTREVPSPTFTLVQTYESPAGPVWHFDAYRLKAPEEIYEIGWEDALTGIVFVEWARRLGKLLPATHLAIHFEYTQNSHADAEQRLVTIKGDDSWALRLLAALPPVLKM